MPDGQVGVVVHVEPHENHRSVCLEWLDIFRKGIYGKVYRMQEGTLSSSKDPALASIGHAERLTETNIDGFRREIWAIDSEGKSIVETWRFAYPFPKAS